MTAMTFEQFQATKTASDDLGNANDCISPEWFVDADGNERKAAGFLYAGDCYIEQMDDGRFYLIIHNYEKVSAYLAELERELYQWAIDEQLFG